MSDEKKSRPRRGRAKAAAVSTHKQRSIKDMLNNKPNQGQDAPTMQAQPVVHVANMSDPETSVRVREGDATITSGSPPDKTIVEATAPKKLYSIFQKPTEREPLPPSSPEISELKIIDLDNNGPPQTKFSLPRKPLHPFFTLSAGAPYQPSVPQTEHVPLEGSSRDDPIVIQSSPVIPTTVLSKSAKSVHPFFSERQKVEERIYPNPQDAPPPPYPDREAQHVVGPRMEVLKYNMFFDRRSGRPPSLSSSSSSQDNVPRADSDHRLMWLTSEDPPITSCNVAALSFRKAEAHTLSTYIDSIPRADQAHPSISRLLQYSDTKLWEEAKLTPIPDQWIDRWRPTRAEQVIGNEEHALYLKHWITALKLHHEHQSRPSEANAKNKKKRKRVKSTKRDVVRHVKKRRRDDYEEDFLAPSDTDEDIPTVASSDFDDFTFCQETLDRMDVASQPLTEDSVFSSQPSCDGQSEASDTSLRAPLKAPRFGRQIRNTILLAGPPGSGKTAAVYACASELGWDVFEVYPGIGERSGAELNKLIGDVGKNHIVKVNHQSTPKVKSKVAFFQGGLGKTKVARRVQSDDEMDDIDIISVSSPAGVEDADASSAEPTVNQSVVLIEEVDVLYHTDTNFWPALINIIKQCRRPVILTCNDISRVPCLDLPLQTTLHFAPCPAPLAGSYLQALCLAQGVEVERDDLIRLYASDDSHDETYLPDLRQSIMQLQFLLADVNISTHTSVPSTAPNVVLPADAVQAVDSITTASSASPSLPDDSTKPVSADQVREEVGTLVEMSRVWDTISFVDAGLSRENNMHLMDLFADETGPSTDDPLGYTILHAQTNTDYCPISAFYQQDERLRDEALMLAQRVTPRAFLGDIPTSISTNLLNVARLRYHALVEPVLRYPISEAPTHAWRASISQEALYLDYAPWIRYIVAADDALESMSQPSSQARRSTRNSSKTSQDRWLKLDVDQRRTLLQSSLRLDAGS